MRCSWCAVPVTLAAAWLWRAATDSPRRWRSARRCSRCITVWQKRSVRTHPLHGQHRALFLAVPGRHRAEWTIAFRAWGALESAPASAAGVARPQSRVGASGRRSGAGLQLDATAGRDCRSTACSRKRTWMRRRACGSCASLISAFWYRLLVGPPLGLWRGSPLAIKAAYGVAAFLTLRRRRCSPWSLMLWRHDPTATPELVYVLTPSRWRWSR